MRTLSLLALGIVLLAPAARAQSTTPAAAQTPARTASAGRQALVRAQAAYVARNFDEALTAFREAATHAPERAEALLGVGYTLSQRGDREGAVSAFREALQLSIAAQEVLPRVRALQAIANTFEGAGRWDEALTAWQEYVDFAERHPSYGTAAYGRSRIETIRDRQDLEHRYAPVRARIEERRSSNGRSAPSR
jgi:Flp pilus assembly protein TadD